MTVTEQVIGNTNYNLSPPDLFEPQKGRLGGMRARGEKEPEPEKGEERT